MRHALGGDVSDPGGVKAPRLSAFRWLTVWFVLTVVYLVVRLVVRWLLSDAGAHEGGVPLLEGLPGRELAIVPAVETLALALLAELRRAVRDSSADPQDLSS